jgi:hypothetical protein
MKRKACVCLPVQAGSYILQPKTNIIILIGKTAFFELYPSLEGSSRLVYSVVIQSIRLHFFGFIKSILFHRARPSALSRSPNLEDQVSLFTSFGDRETLGTLSVAFYDWQSYGGGILTRLHTGSIPKRSSAQFHFFIFLFNTRKAEQSLTTAMSVGGLAGIRNC